ncbi:MAG: GDP/GTP exchange factor for ARF [Marteilia pararefringens]
MRASQQIHSPIANSLPILLKTFRLRIETALRDFPLQPAIMLHQDSMIKKINSIDEFKLKFMTLTTIQSLLEHHKALLTPEVVHDLFFVAFELSSSNTQLHDKSLLVLESMIQQLFGILTNYSECPDSSYHQNIKSLIKTSHMNVIKSLNSKSNSFLIGLVDFQRFKSIEEIHTEHFFASDSVNSFLSSVTSKVCTDSATKYYNCLSTIILYLSNRIVVIDSTQSENHSFKILSLKLLHSIIACNAYKIASDMHSIHSIITNHLMYNITQVLVFFNSPLIDFQFHTCTLLTAIIESFKNIMQVVYVQLNLLVNRLVVIINQISIDKKISIFDTSQIMSLIGLIDCLISCDSIALEIYLISDMDYYNASIFENLIKSLTQLLMMNIDDKLFDKIISLLKNVATKICITNVKSEKSGDNIVKLLEKKNNIKSAISKIADKISEDQISTLQDAKSCLNYDDESYEHNLVKILNNSKLLNPIKSGKFLLSSKGKPLVESYISQFDLHGLRFEDALRIALSKIRLTGDSFTIEHYMETLSGVYLKQNPDCGLSLKALQSLSLSALLLNVNCHAPPANSRTSSMKKENFIAAIKNVDTQVNEGLVARLYDDIIQCEIILPYDRGNLPYLALTWYFEIDAKRNEIPSQLMEVHNKQCMSFLFQKITNHFLNSIVSYLADFTDRNTGKASQIVDFLNWLFKIADILGCSEIFNSALNSIFSSISLFSNFKTTIEFCYQLQTPVTFLKLDLIFSVLQNYSYQIDTSNTNILSMFIIFYKYRMIPDKLVKFHDCLFDEIIDHNNLLSTPLGLENEPSSSHFLRFFTSQNAESEIKNNRSSVINGLKEELRIKIDNCLSLFKQPGFIMLIFNAIYEQIPDYSVSDYCEDFDVIKLKTWLLDMAFSGIHSYRSTSGNLEEDRSKFTQQMFNTIKDMCKLHDQVKNSTIFSNEHFLARLIDNIHNIASGNDLDKISIISYKDIVLQLTEIIPSNSNRLRLYLIKLLRQMFKNDWISKVVLVQKLEKIGASVTIDKFSSKLSDLCLEIIKDLISADIYDRDLEEAKEILNFADQIILVNNRVYDEVMPLFKQQNSPGAVIKDEEFKIPNSFLLDLQLSHLELLNVLEFCLHKITETKENYETSIVLVTQIIKILVRSVTNKRLKVSNDAIQKIATTFKHIEAIFNFEDIQHFFKIALMDSFEFYANLIVANSGEEILFRTINQFSQIYLNYILPHELNESEVTEASGENIQKFDMLILYMTKLHSLKPEGLTSDFSETLEENVRNIMLVIKESAQDWQRDYLFRNLEELKFSESEKNIFNEIFTI